MDNGDTLRTVEIEVISDTAMVTGSRSEPIILSRALIVTQCFKSRLIHLSTQTQTLGTFTVPFTNDLLFLTIILAQLGGISFIFQAAGIVIPGLRHILATENSQHILHPDFHRYELRERGENS